MEKQIEEMVQDICKLGKPCEKCSAYPDACKAVKLMRDRLIELLQEFADGTITGNGHIVDGTEVNLIADYLLANGVIVPPCKVGDVVYVITNCENILMYHDNDYHAGTGAIECPFENSCDFEECDDSNLRIFETRVVTIHCEEDLGWTFWCEHINKDFIFSEIGKTVFLTREEAEAKLKGGEGCG